MALVEKNGPASEKFLLVHFTGRSAPRSQPNRSPRQALASASSDAPDYLLSARFGAGTAENENREFYVVGGGWPLGRNWTYFAKCMGVFGNYGGLGGRKVKHSGAPCRRARARRGPASIIKTPIMPHIHTMFSAPTSIPSRYDQFMLRFVPGGTNRVRALRADRGTAPAAERIVGNETASKLLQTGALGASTLASGRPLEPGGLRPVRLCQDRLGQDEPVILGGSRVRRGPRGPRAG